MSRSGAGPAARRVSDPGAEARLRIRAPTPTGAGPIREIPVPGARIDRLASGALGRRVGALGGRVGLGGQRGDALIEARGARVEIVAAFADLAGEQPPAAQQKVREPKRAPKVERDGQGAKDEQNLRRSIEPIAVRRHPIPGGLQRIAPVARSRRSPFRRAETAG